MKKLMVLAAMLAMMLVAAAPAFAETTQTSGDATVGGAVVSADDLVNQAVQVANAVNTGNQNQDIATIQANLQANVTTLEDMASIMETGPGDQNVGVNTGTQTGSATTNAVQIGAVDNAQQMVEQALAAVIF